jgi:hypothetical protein
MPVLYCLEPGDAIKVHRNSSTCTACSAVRYAAKHRLSCTQGRKCKANMLTACSGAIGWVWRAAQGGARLLLQD